MSNEQTSASEKVTACDPSKRQHTNVAFRIQDDLYIWEQDETGEPLINEVFTLFLRYAFHVIAYELQILRGTGASRWPKSLSVQLLTQCCSALEHHTEVMNNRQVHEQLRFQTSRIYCDRVWSLLHEAQALSLLKDYVDMIGLSGSQDVVPLKFLVPLAGIARNMIRVLMSHLRHRASQDIYRKARFLLKKELPGLLNAFESVLKEIIENQSQSEALTDYHTVVEHLGNIVSDVITSLLDIHCQDLGIAQPVELHNLTLDVRGEAARVLYMLPHLTVMIRCKRSMDCRTSGVKKLSDLLIQTYNSMRNKDSQGLEYDSSTKFSSSQMINGIHRYIAAAIESTGIIKYLVGPESHPELAKISSNIGSFLVVNHSIQRETLDCVWMPLYENNDPRRVQAIIQMITEFETHMNYEELIDSCKRATKIPIVAYDNAMLDFVRTLIHRTTRAFEGNARNDNVQVRVLHYALVVKEGSVSHML